MGRTIFEWAPGRVAAREFSTFMQELEEFHGQEELDEAAA